MTHLPPLETLRVFEVACRHGSYSEAARELHVTHSAVSQRIRQLEEDLGLTLFERQGNRMVPTGSGCRRVSQAPFRNWARRSPAFKRAGPRPRSP
jgi:LysR family transcriptional regulator, glycine cleavage system transcriptional activator